MTTIWENILKRTSGESATLMDDTVVIMESTIIQMAGQAIATIWTTLTKSS